MYNNNDNDSSNNRNLLIALFAFGALMFGYNIFLEPSSTPQKETQEQASHQEEHEDIQETNTTAPTTAKISKNEALSQGKRISIENSKLAGSIDLQGAVLDCITLKKYKESPDKESKNVDIFAPKGTENEYYYAISYNDKTNDSSIDGSAVWSFEGRGKQPQEAFFKTRTSSGIVIERTITIDDEYMFTIKDKIVNISGKDVKMSRTEDLIRSNPLKNNYAVVHEGIVLNNDGKVDELKYSDIEGKSNLQKCSWIGYTDLYWFCSLINKNKTSKVMYSKTSDESYKCSIAYKSDINIQANSAVEVEYSLFAGPKDIRVLKGYAQMHGLDKFEMAIDFGWFFIITKPLLHLVDILAELFKNMGFVILFLTLLLKLLTYPLMRKSVNSAAKMRELQPKIASIQKSYEHDKLRMNQELMALYKREKVSPMSGCLPMLLQAPIFFCLYKVFFISIEMRHAPLFGWIKDLSAPDPMYIFNLFGAIDWSLPSFLKIGIWPIIMGLSMFLQQKLSSGSAKKNVEKTQEAKIQENMMLFMPVLFTYICASFPVGVVIYWTISNIFSIVQQYYANKKVSTNKRG